jgi:hypothetical protein
MRTTRFVTAGLLMMSMLAGCKAGWSPFTKKTAATPQSAAPAATTASLPQAMAAARPTYDGQQVSAQMPQQQAPTAAPPATQPAPKEKKSFTSSLKGFLPSGNDDAEREGWHTPAYRGISD